MDLGAAGWGRLFLCCEPTPSPSPARGGKRDGKCCKIIIIIKKKDEEILCGEFAPQLQRARAGAGAENLSQPESKNR